LGNIISGIINPVPTCLLPVSWANRAGIAYGSETFIQAYIWAVVSRCRGTLVTMEASSMVVHTESKFVHKTEILFISRRTSVTVPTIQLWLKWWLHIVGRQKSWT